jgi:hypothetical protein
MPENNGPLFVTLGLFIVDEFEFRDENGEPTGKLQKSEAREQPFLPTHTTDAEFLLKIGGGGTYAVIGARIWFGFSLYHPRSWKVDRETGYLPEGSV